jgi:hypothetical protein
MMKGMARALAFLLAALLLVTPGSGEAWRNRALLILDDYDSAVRWSDFDLALSFVDPAVRADHPITDLERQRFDLVQVSTVTVRSTAMDKDRSIDRVVEIGVIAKLTQRERTVVDHQHWRWDKKSKRYWLMSGLPDFNATD